MTTEKQSLKVVAILLLLLSWALVLFAGTALFTRFLGGCTPATIDTTIDNAVTYACAKTKAQAANVTKPCKQKPQTGIDIELPSHP